MGTRGVAYMTMPGSMWRACFGVRGGSVFIEIFEAEGVRSDDTIPVATLRMTTEGARAFRALLTRYIILADMTIEAEAAASAAKT